MGGNGNAKFDILVTYGTKKETQNTAAEFHFDFDL